MSQDGQGNTVSPAVSIIVACKSTDPYLSECIERCRQLDYPDYELIVLPDQETEAIGNGLVVIPTGPVKPSEKRNIGVSHSRGQLIAFIDGDAYPSKDWLKKAVEYFRDPRVAAVGGPGLTPETDEIAQKASGEILASFIGAGTLAFRHSSTHARKSDDLPTVNLIVRRSTFEELGGFDSSFWPGEDTKFCLDLVFKEGKEMLYAPDVQVFHHRRALFRPHLKQIAGYGFHRGYFARKFPENSRRPLYFMPSLLVIGFPVAIFLGFFNGFMRSVTIVLALLYLAFLSVGAILSSVRNRSATLGGLFFLGTIATHVCYGVNFSRGLLSRGTNVT